jgi:hypothetical protein
MMDILRRLGDSVLADVVIERRKISFWRWSGPRDGGRRFWDGGCGEGRGSI